MPRICLLADADSIHTRKWIDYFSSIDNYEIHIISMRSTKYKYKSNVTLHIIEPSFKNKLSYFLNITAIKKLVNEINPDLLHSHYATSYGLYGRMCNFHPFIISVWGSDVYEFPNKGIFNKTLLKYILAGADKVCSTSKNMAQETSKYYRPQINVTPFGVNIDKFINNKSILQNDFITIGVNKNLESIYGINYLIEAFSILCDELSELDLRLLIVGNGTEKTNLEEQCRKLGVSKKVTFTGAVDNTKIPDLLNEMDLVCIPSISESFGVAAVEAGACGRPVICTNVGGLKEIIFDNYNGFLVSPASILELKDKIKFTIINKPLMHEFSKNAREYVLKNYNWEKNAAIMKKIYEEVMEARR